MRETAIPTQDVTLAHYQAQAETARQITQLQEEVERWRNLAERLQAQADEMRSGRLVVPDGWRLVPIEPTPSMIDVAVSHALMVSLSADYNWSAYMRDVWLRMLAAAPTPPTETDSMSDYLMVPRELLERLVRLESVGLNTDAECEELRALLAAPAVAEDEREAFETQWTYRSRDDEGNPGAKPLRSLLDSERYRGSAVNGSWVWFQHGAAWQRTRPAQTEQQPVAWADPSDLHRLETGSLNCINVYRVKKPCVYEPLFLRAAPIAQTPADQPSDCEWCAGARHDYYGEKCNHCQVTADGLVEALAGLPDVCDGLEQEAFEDYARKEGMDMRTHPLHWLFLDKETYAARKGWRAAIRYCREAMAAHRAGGEKP